MAKVRKKWWVFLVLVPLLAGCHNRLLKHPLPAGTANWVQWGGPVRGTLCMRGVAPFDSLTEIKRIKLQASPEKTILTRDGAAVVPTLAGRLWAFALPQGKKLGESKLPGRIPGSAVLYRKDVVVAQRFGKKTVFRFDPLSGKKLWRLKLGDVETEPLLSGDTLFVTTLFEGAVAVQADSGKCLWKKKLGAQSHSSPNLGGRKLIFGDDKGRLFALNRQNGDSLFAVPLGGIIRAAPVARNGRIFVGTTRGGFFSVDAKTGKILWQTTVSAEIVHAAAVSEKAVFFVANDGFLYKRETQTGALFWKKNLGGVAGTPPLVLGKRVVLGTLEHELLVLSADDGNILFRKKLKGRIRTLPVPWKKYLLVGSEERWLYIFRREEKQP